MTRTLLGGLTALLVAFAALGATPPDASAACTITLPKAGIYVQSGTLYRNVPIAFSASGTPTRQTGCTTQPNGTRIVKWEWDFDGNGSVDRVTTSGSTSSSTSYTYTSVKAGWKAQIRATDDLGNSSAWNFVLFSTVNKPPTASLSAPATAIKNQPVTFSGAGSTDQTGDPTPHIRRYHWDIDGNLSYTSAATTSKTFSLTGDKTIRLRVEDADGGLSDWVSQTVKVQNPPPVISSISVSNASPTTGQSVTLSASASAPAGGSLSYTWNLGDGRTSTSSTPSVAWSTPGTKSVSLTVKDQYGGTATATKAISVQGRPPVAAFACTPLSPFAGEQITCTSSSTDPDDGIASQWWDVNGDGAADSYASAISFTATTPGTVNVRLTVRDGSGISRYADKAITVVERKLLASFTVAPASATVGQAVAFDASASRDPGGPITKYEWDLDGNGSYETQTGTNPKATRTYTAAGTVTVRLRVTSGAGTAVTTRSVVVSSKSAPTPPVTGGGGGTPSPAPGGQPAPSPAARAVVVASPQSAVAGGKASASKTSSKTASAKRRAPKAGACAKLKGKKRSACVAKQCRGLKGAKQRACAKKVSRKVTRKAKR